MTKTDELDENTYYVEELIKAKDKLNKAVDATAIGITTIAFSTFGLSILGVLGKVGTAGILTCFLTGGLVVGVGSFAYGMVAAITPLTTILSQYKELSKKSGLEIHYENVVKVFDNREKRQELEGAKASKPEHEFDSGRVL